ncbi:hypothetical protein QN277_010156 [Acacia crassicarpa]|uniref:Pre-rRNA-processing protein TSR2 homolog n=1 Tax=Acacia crassicarpa TaxID=499986 RepID=A0AAE1M515_9FABA|nr:hypothetical protein QN277_010156 [Acacia crassicarpa]
MAGRLPADSIPNFNEGLHLVLYSWEALRYAVENGLGGPHSRQKAETLGSDILHWFTQSEEPLYIDDLESMLYEGMVSLNLEIEDGSVEEVAMKLMILHEECLEGNFRSIEILREAVLKQAACAHAIQVVNNDDDEEEEDNDDGGSNQDGHNSNMEEEEDNDDGGSNQDGHNSNMEEEDNDDGGSNLDGHNSNMEVEMQVPVEETMPKAAAEEEDDGWTLVPRRRNKVRN